MSQFRRLAVRAAGLGLAALAVMTAAQTAEASQMVAVDPSLPSGTVIIRTQQRSLYYILGNGQAIRYTVAVGKAGKQWQGATFIEGKVANPAWSPPAVVKRDNPALPDVIPPGPRNPMGTRAILLAGDEYAIHGTNRPETVGKAASYGCFRMYNADVEDLFERVSVGTRVVVQP